MEIRNVFDTKIFNLKIDWFGLRVNLFCFHEHYINRMKANIIKIN
jgi:hypothetical protein